MKDCYLVERAPFQSIHRISKRPGGSMELVSRSSGSRKRSRWPSSHQGRPTLAAYSNHQDTVAGCRLLRGAIKLNHGFLSHSPEPNIRHSLTSPQTLSLQSRLEVSLLCRAAGPARHAQADASERLVDMHGTLTLINPFDRLTSFLCPSIRLPTRLNPMLAAPCLRHHPPPGEPCQTDQ